MKALTGNVACNGYAKGSVFILGDSPKSLDSMKMGQVIAMRFASPNFFEFFLKASAVVTEYGGITCHAASLARELNLPCVVAVDNLIESIHEGDILTVDATEGKIYVEVG